MCECVCVCVMDVMFGDAFVITYSALWFIIAVQWPLLCGT